MSDDIDVMALRRELIARDAARAEMIAAVIGLALMLLIAPVAIIAMSAARAVQWASQGDRLMKLATAGLIAGAVALIYT